MREGVWGERALGCPDRGLLGGFAAGMLRTFGADPKTGGRGRSWAMAALTSYGLKTPTDRHDVCSRLAGLVERKGGDPPPGLNLDDSLTTLPNVGPKTGAALEAMGLRTIGDLLDRFPRDYLDWRAVRKIRDLRVGEEVTIAGVVRDSKVGRTRNGRRYFTCKVYDGTGYVECVWWQQDWRAKQLGAGVQASFSGRIERGFGRLPQLTNPLYDLLGSDDKPSRTGRMLPVYPASEQMPSYRLLAYLEEAFARIGPISDPLPARVRATRDLIGKDDAYRYMHFPEGPEQVAEGRRRLVFEELFTLELGLALRKRHLERTVRGIVHDPKADLPARFVQTMPFRPTGAQTRAMREINQDMAKPVPMHRLLQGEVGSGKTLVAVYAALVAVGSGNQAAIMAPTEVLAEQHARKIRQLVEPLGVDVALLTSSVPAAQRRDTLLRLASGEIGVACGTHALISEGVAFKRLSLAIVDEQHRFGLRQRIMLKSKGEDPDVLIMTATPIPRTLALTLYGDLDVTILDELPAGRQPIDTVVVGPDEREREGVYELVRGEVAEGRRAYVVCALVDESDVLEAKAAVAEAERLRTEVFPDLAVGLLHGQMRPSEKDAVMADFRDGRISVLIATTVIEVGVDVPEATVMIIENAERFGLSQLHQLRGRVGRGAHKSWCFLFGDPSTPDGQARLDAIAATGDGFALAEEDLRIRGEGTIFGTRQAGMPDLKLARLVEDFPVVVEAREAAFALVDADPQLQAAENTGLRDEIARRFEGQLDWLFHG